MRTRLRVALFAAGLTVFAAACTPAEIALYLESTGPTRDVLSDAELLRLRMCESTDNYRAISPSGTCLLYTSPSPRDKRQSRMPSSA